MATGGGSHVSDLHVGDHYLGGVSSRLASVRQLLLCTICYDRYKEPRILPCLHSFCEGCLEKYLGFHQQQYLQQISLNPLHRLHEARFPCPTCREKMLIPAQGVKGFRRDFRAIQIQDYLSLTENSIVPECATCITTKVNSEYYCSDCQQYLCSICKDTHINTNHTMKTLEEQIEEKEEHTTCSVHKQDDLRYFCINCKLAICLMCKTSSHTTHRCVGLQEHFRKQLSVIITRNNELKKCTTVLRRTEEQLKDKESLLKNAKERCIMAIENRAQHVISAAEEQKQTLTDQVKITIGEEENNVTKRLQQVDTLLSNMTDMTTSVDEFQAKNQTPTQKVEELEELTTQLNVVLENVAATTSSNKQSTILDVQFIATRKQLKLGKISTTSKTSSDVVTTETPIRMSRHLPSINNRRPAARRTVSQPPMRHNSTTTSGLSRAFTLPSTRTRHRNSNNSPVCMFGGSGTMPGDLDTPRDVCIIQDSIIVADTGNDRLSVFSLSGELSKTLCHTQIKPWAVCATVDNQIAVADAMNRCIQIITLNGAIIKKFGSFLCPCGIATDTQGKFYLTDFFSSSVYVLNSNGVKLRQFDFRSQRPSIHSSGPARVAVSRHGFVVIADTSNKQVSVFTKYGNALATIVQGPELGVPQSVHVDCYDRIWLLDSINMCVSVFSLTGQNRGILLKIHSIRNEQCNSISPVGMSVSLQGDVYITDIKQSQILRYKTN